MAKKTAIRCPHCGREYLPGEIYYPNDFIGKPTNIIRGFNGDILGYDGTDMDTKESYTCDECGKKFTVDAVVTFKTEKVMDIFDEEDFEVESEK